MRTLLLVAAIGTAILGAFPAHAQHARTVAEGDVIEVRLRGGQRYSGSVLQVTDSQLVLETHPRGLQQIVSNREVTQLRIANGRDVKRGMQVGAAFGGALGAVAGFAKGSREEGLEGLMDPGYGFLIGATAGALLGIGAAPYKWVPGSLPAARVSPARLPDGRIGLAISARF